MLDIIDKKNIEHIKSILDFSTSPGLNRDGSFRVGSSRATMCENDNGTIKCRKLRVSEEQKDDIISLNNLKCVEDLLELKPKDFMKVNGIGKVRANDIYTFLQDTRNDYNHLLKSKIFNEVLL